MIIFRVRKKWNLLRYCSSVVSLEYSEFKTELDEEQNQRSYGEKLGNFLDKKQVYIQLLAIYAGLIGIILEGNYSDIFRHLLTLFIKAPLLLLFAISIILNFRTLPNSKKVYLLIRKS